MQYTGGSFGRTASDWFSWILRPVRALRRPHGAFPLRAALVEHVPETVLERVVGPAADAIMSLSLGARRLQHGRLQFYIVYLVGGLTALAMLVLLG
jgi:hydrogenase-4 component B